MRSLVRAGSLHVQKLKRRAMSLSLTGIGHGVPPALPCLWVQADTSPTVLVYFHANAEDLGPAPANKSEESEPTPCPSVVEVHVSAPAEM
eukprot:4319794-Amphidinium_carterae.1